MKKSIVDIFETRVIDENAFTIEELAKEKNYSRSQMAKLVTEKLKSGEIEQVWKKVGGYPVRAYRLKKP